MPGRTNSPGQGHRPDVAVAEAARQPQTVARGEAHRGEVARAQVEQGAAQRQGAVLLGRLAGEFDGREVGGVGRARRRRPAPHPCRCRRGWDRGRAAAPPRSAAPTGRSGRAAGSGSRGRAAGRAAGRNRGSRRCGHGRSAGGRIGRRRSAASAPGSPAPRPGPGRRRPGRRRVPRAPPPAAAAVPAASACPGMPAIAGRAGCGAPGRGASPRSACCTVGLARKSTSPRPSRITSSPSASGRSAWPCSTRPRSKGMNRRARVRASVRQTRPSRT